MSKEREVLKLALEALAASDDFLFNYHDCEPNNEREMDAYSEVRANNMAAWEAVREALAEQPAQQQEPVAFDVVCHDCGGDGFDRQDSNYRCTVCNGAGFIEKMLYTSPPASKPWVGLIDEDVEEVERWVEFKEEGSGRIPVGKLVRYIEAKLRELNEHLEKNNG